VEDEESAVVLADWAAIAIANARLYRAVRERRDELERTMRGLETTTEISLALGGVTDLDQVLELVVKRSRALIDARAAEIALLDGDEFVIAALAGAGVAGLKHTRVPVSESVAEPAVRTGRQQRLDEIPRDTFAAREIGARSAIVTPMLFRNRPVGFLSVFDRRHGDRPFSDEDERLMQAFAASAATAVATAQNASEEALRRAIDASEAERTRWARELHDVGRGNCMTRRCSSSPGCACCCPVARRSGEPERMVTAIDGALEQITLAIGDLRSLITELRPAALDELGTKPAIESLIARFHRQTDLDVDFAYENDDAEFRHVSEVESTVYRLVQEALNNVTKHAGAKRVEVRVSDLDDEITLSVRDDGRGFDPQAATAGFGLLGMRERLALVGGALELESAPGSGTVLRAAIPVKRPGAIADRIA
jgi:signal transduction histidine kinase